MVTEEKEKNKEQAILEAAEKEFLEKGFDATKTTNIASQAGVTHAMLHYYFRTKENLFDMVFDRKINLLKESLLSLLNTPDLPLLERIKTGMEIHFDFLAANPKIPRFVINELISKPKRRDIIVGKIKKIIEHVIEQLQNEIDSEVKKGTIHPIDSVTLLLNIISLNVFVFISLPILTNIPIPPHKDINEFLEARKKENIEVIMRRLKK